MSRFNISKIRHLDAVDRLPGAAPVTIGRADDNDIVLPNTAVSRHHAIIATDGGVSMIRDLGSRHGVRVNGEPISGPTEVTDGDQIGIGPFLVTIGDDQPAEIGTSRDSTAELHELQELQSELEARASELQALDGALEEHRHALKEREHDLTQQGEDASRRQVELSEQIRSLEQARSAWDEARREQDAQLQEQAERLDRLQHELTAALAEREADRRRITETEAALAERSSALHSMESERKQVTSDRSTALNELQSQRNRADKLAHTLETRVQQLERTQTDADTAREQAARFEAAALAAYQRAQGAEISLRQLEGGSQRLLEISRRISSIHRAMAAMETLWIETNDWVEGAAEGDPQILEQATQQRDSVSARLEAAHTERDSVVHELQAMVEQLGRAAAVGIRRRAMERPAPMPPVGSTEPKKKWSIFK